MKRRARTLLVIVALIALTWTFAEEFRSGNSDDPVDLILPLLPDYRTVEGQTLTSYVTGLAEGAALLSGQPQLAIAVGVVDRVADCYQDVGGVRSRLYSQVGNPLASGLVVVADAQRVRDPEIVLRCVAPTALALEGAGESVIEPCAGTYVMNHDGRDYYIAYVATTNDVCRDFCASLKDCPISAPPLALPENS